MWLIELVFPQCCKSDMPKYGYLEVFQRVPWNSRQRESTVYIFRAEFRLILQQIYLLEVENTQQRKNYKS